jgi:hypothetical protein
MVIAITITPLSAMHCARRFLMMKSLLSALDFVVPTDHKGNF